MIKLLLLLLVFFSTSSWGETEYSRKVHLAAKNLSELAAKDHQIHQAVWEVILGRSVELKFDASSLKSAVEERFDKYWTDVKARRLRERFGKGFEPTDEARKNFLEGLETQRQNEFRSYLRLASLLEEVSVKSHVQEAGDSWTSEVFFRMNQGKLDRFLKRFLAKEVWLYDNLYVISEIDLSGGRWQDFGLEKAEDFISPLRSSWADLARNFTSSTVEDVRECKDDCLEAFREWLKASLSERSLDGGSIFRKSVILKITYSLKRNNTRPLFGEVDIDWEGKFVLVDGATKKTLFSASIPRMQKTFQQLSLKDLNSAIAGYMYRHSTGFFNTLDSTMKSSKRFSRLTVLTLSGHSHLGDVLAFNGLLRKEGLELALDPQIDLFTLKEARVLAFYAGEEKSFSDLLSRLKELKSSQSYKIISEPAGNGFSLKFIAE